MTEEFIKKPLKTISVYHTSYLQLVELAKANSLTQAELIKSFLDIYTDSVAEVESELEELVEEVPAQVVEPPVVEKLIVKREPVIQVPQPAPEKFVVKGEPVITHKSYSAGSPITFSTPTPKTSLLNKLLRRDS